MRPGRRVTDVTGKDNLIMELARGIEPPTG
jgi:hypothetical protein